MSKFHCDFCCYNSNKKDSYQKHLRSQKHLNNIKNITNNNSNTNNNGNINNNSSTNDKDKLDKVKSNQDYQCDVCNIKFANKYNLANHIKSRCPVSKKKNRKGFDFFSDDSKEIEFYKKIIDVQNSLIQKEEKISEEKERYIKLQNRHLKNNNNMNDSVIPIVKNTTNNTTHNTTNNTNNTLNNLVQNTTNKNLIFLNGSMGEMIDMKSFIENYQLDPSQTKTLVECYQLNGITSYAMYLNKALKDNCYKQLQEKGIDMPYGCIPIVTTDSNLRNFKMKTEKEWETTTDNSDLETLVVISNDQAYKHHQTPIFISPSDRVKVVRYIKRHNDIKNARETINQSQS